MQGFLYTHDFPSGNASKTPTLYSLPPHCVTIRYSTRQSVQLLLASFTATQCKILGDHDSSNANDTEELQSPPHFLIRVGKGSVKLLLLKHKKQQTLQTIILS